MNFLIYIDNLRKDYMENSNIDNKDYLYYATIKFDIGNQETVDILCGKRHILSLYLMSNDGIKIYFSDFDIIKTLKYLLENYQEIGEQIITYLKKYLHNERISYQYIINNQTFTGLGIPLIRTECQILTKEDQYICLRDYIIILNMILEKERKTKRGNDKDAIAKYLTFIDFFHYNNTDCRIVLRGAGYRIDSLNKMRRQLEFSGRNKKIIRYKDVKNIQIMV